MSTVAGSGATGYNGDGIPATAASLNDPTGIALDAAGNLYIADAANNRIRRVDVSTGVITTVAGAGSRGFSGDGGPATGAMLACPTRVAFDSFGDLYIADQCNHRIRVVDGAGMIRTVVGSGSAGAALGGFSGDNGQAMNAQFRHPTAFAIGGAGELYISDQQNFRIRRVDSAGVVTTIAGNGVRGFAGDGGPGPTGSIGDPGMVAVDAAGNVYFGDPVNHRVRRIGLDGRLSTIAGTGAAASTGDGGPATAAALHEPFGVALDPFGNLYVLEAGSHRIRRIEGAAPAAPTFSAAGVTNGASFRSGVIAPGTIVTVFGVNLTAANGILTASQTPLPTSLGGTTVTVGGRLAPLFAVVRVNGAEQINLLWPFETGVAQSASTAEVVIHNGSFRNTPVAVRVGPAQPGIFSSGPNPAILHGADNAIITAANPAQKGEVIVVFCTGLGAVQNPPASGDAASSTVLSPTVTAPSATVGGVSADVLFSGLAPGFVGLYQVNLLVPEGAQSGTPALVLTQNGVESNAVGLAVE